MQGDRILLPILPEYAKSILEGTKRFEFRKTPCRAGTKTILLYATTPVRAVVGEVEILDIHVGPPNEIWEITADAAGISRQAFNRYYLGHEKAVAYRLGVAEQYSCPLKLTELGINYTPQAPVYL
jgi:predicted transcriptional regulator